MQSVGIEQGGAVVGAFGWICVYVYVVRVQQDCAVAGWKQFALRVFAATILDVYRCSSEAHPRPLICHVDW